MKFSCDRCHKRFSTTDEPVPGRVYRIPCKCGNTIVLQLHAAGEPPPVARASRAAPEPSPGRAAPPPLPVAPAPSVALPERTPAVAAAWRASGAAPVEDDPFVRARRDPDLRVLLAHASEEVTPTLLAPQRARRDPDAPLELSSVFAQEPALDPFVEELRRTRTHALALGGAAGAAVGAFCAAAISLVVLHPWSPAIAETATPSAEPRAAQAEAQRAPERLLAGRKTPAVRLASSVAAATPRPHASAPIAPPSPSPSEPAVVPALATEREAVVPVPAAVERAAPEPVEAAAAEPAAEAGQRETSAPEPPAPVERPAGAVEQRGAAAPEADAGLAAGEPADRAERPPADASDPPAPARDP